MTDNIKQLYKEIDRKTEFIQMVADHFKKSPQYLRGHWFSSFWQVPEKYQEELIKIMQNTIKQQQWNY